MKKRKRRTIPSQETTPVIAHTTQKYEITEEGSLGLLALGYQGLVLWRKKKAEAKQNAVGDLQ